MLFNEQVDIDARMRALKNLLSYSFLLLRQLNNATNPAFRRDRFTDERRIKEQIVKGLGEAVQGSDEATTS